jgi:hypothetical protein
MFVGRELKTTIDQDTEVLSILEGVNFGADLAKPEVFHRMRVCRCWALEMTLMKTK